MHEFVHTARRLFAGRKFQDAVKVCRLGLLKDPACLEGRIVLGQSLLSLARYDEVLAEARAALEIQDRSAEATVLLGEALFFKGAFGQARQVLARAAEIDPENAKVARLLSELDATAQMGLDTEDAAELADETRSYPTAEADLAAIGDETEIQETPPDMMGSALSLPGSASAPAEVEPQGTAPPEVPESRSPFLEPNPLDDEDRPDPIAGEVQVESRVPKVEAPTETVDLSGANLLPEPEPRYYDEEEIPLAKEAPPQAPGDHPGGAAPDPDETATEIPVRERQASSKPKSTPASGGSHSGRRWADRKWLQTKDALTREAVVVPSPQLTTQEMEDSDLFGRGSSPKEAPTQLLRKGSGESADPSVTDPQGPSASGLSTEDATAAIRPGGSGSLPRPRGAARPDPTPLPTFEEDEETASLKHPASAPTAPPSPQSKGAPKLPHRATPRPNARGSAGAPPTPSLAPLLGGRRGALPPSAPSSSASGPHQNPFSNIPGEISGVAFEPPPAAPPPGIRPLGPLPVPAPTSGLSSPATRPTMTQGSNPKPAPSSRSSSNPMPLSPRSPSAPGPARMPSTGSTARPITQRAAHPAAARTETTARTRKPWRWWVRRHRTGVALGSVIAACLLGLVLALSLRSSGNQEEEQRLAQSARTALRTGTFGSLERADRLLLHWVRRDKGSRRARSLRLLVASLLAVEHGVAVDRTRDLVRQAAHPEDAPGQAGAALSALAAETPSTALKRARRAARQHPSSPWLAYARATIQTWLGHQDIALTRLAGIEPGDARLFLIRARARALLASGRAQEALGLLDALKPAERHPPWAVVLTARIQIARSADPIPRSVQDGLVGLLALPQEAASPHQRRWAHLLLAEAYERLGKETLRSKHASAALATHTKATPPSLDEGLARHLLHHRQPARALQLASHVQKAYPDRATAVAAVATAALALSDAPRARRAIETLAVERRTVTVKLLLVRALLSLGKPQEAQKALQKLRRTQPENATVRLAWARLLAKRNHSTEALREVETLLRQHPRLVEAIALAAQIERSLGKMTDAAMRFEAAVRLRPRDPALRAEFVGSLIASGNLRSAANTLDAAEAAFPKSPLLLGARARLLLEQGHVVEAIQRFRQAEKKRPSDPDLLFGLAEALLYEHRIRDAEPLVVRAEGIDPRRASGLRGWLARLRWNRKKGDPSTAISRLAKAARGQGRPAFHAAMLLLDAVALRWGRRAARRKYRALVKRLGRRPELAGGLALAQINDDANQAALSTLGRALSSPALQRIHPYVKAELLARRAQAYWQAGSFSQARRAANHALRINPRSPRAQAILGIVDYENRRFRSALRKLKKALALDQRLPLTRYYLGMAYLQFGRRSSARPQLRAYLSILPRGPLAPDARQALRR